MTKRQEGLRYEIKALANDSAEIRIYGDVASYAWGEETTTAAQFVKDLAAITASTIVLRINSAGGSVPDGLAIYNALKRHAATIDVHIDGWALSIASLIAMAGDTVTMAENALFMVHAPWMSAYGNAAALREAADVLDKFAAAMATSYAAKSGKPEAEILALLSDGEDHWYTAQEALEAGFIDAVGAPVAVEASFDLSRFRNIPAAAAALNPPQKETLMPDKPMQPAAAAQPAAPVQQPAHSAQPEAPYARSAVETAEIRAFFAPFKGRDGVQAMLEDFLADPAVTPAKASADLLKRLGQGAEPATPAGHVPRVQTVEDETEKFRAACAVSILARAAVPAKEVKDLAANPYRGHKLLDIARASLERIGVAVRGMSQLEIVAAAFTQTRSDFPVLLETAMHKALQTAYATQPDTWSRFCALGSVTDFRAHNRYRLGSFGSLDSLNELGEFKNKTIPDGEKASISASTKGNIINLSRQAVIDDDLGAFVGLAGLLGRAARRTIEVDVYALLAQNSGMGPIMADSNTLFHANHGNVAAAGAISVAVIDDCRVKMASQKDVSGNDYLDLRPAVWLGPIGTGGDARVINGAEYDPDTANKLQRPNKVRGLFRDVVDTPRLTGTRFYIFADPNEAPVIEVAFLDGNQEPHLERMDGFEVDGSKYKVRLDYGVGAIDYRGATTAAGA